MEFAKLHGLGNDFLVAHVDLRGRAVESFACLARQICHRRCGVGADGILYYQVAAGDPEADFETRIFNADGSEAEVSGNGMRCLGAFLHHSGKSTSPSIRIRGITGIKLFTLRSQEGRIYNYESAMGCPITDPKLIGVNLG